MNENSVEELDNRVNENFEDPTGEEHVVPESQKKESKQHKAIRLTREAKNMVKEADRLSSVCKLLLEDDLAEYKDAKLNLKERGFDTCEALLEQMGYNSIDDEPFEEATVLERNVIVEPIIIKEIFSGKFTATILALMAGGVTATGILYLATQKLGMTLDLDKVPSLEMRENILGWLSTSIGMEANIYIGAGVFGVSVLAVMAIVYVLRVSLKANANLHIAVKQFAEAELYTEDKTDCKEEMDRVDIHMRKAIKIFETYEILFNEQQGKLQRIMYIEGKKEQASDYHTKSYTEIRESKKLLHIIKDFMAMPMSKGGKLSKESVLHLEKLKIQMNDMIERLY